MSLPVEEVFAANGIIAPPGVVVSTFGGYVRPNNVWISLDWTWYSAVAVSGVTLYLAPAVGSPLNDRCIVLASASTANALRGCVPVPRDLLAGGAPFILGIEKTIVTNANVRICWHDVEAP